MKSLHSQRQQTFPSLTSWNSNYMVTLASRVNRKALLRFVIMLERLVDPNIHLSFCFFSNALHILNVAHSTICLTLLLLKLVCMPLDDCTDYDYRWHMIQQGSWRRIEIHCTLSLSNYSHHVNLNFWNILPWSWSLILRINQLCHGIQLLIHKNKVLSRNLRYWFLSFMVSLSQIFLWVDSLFN
jgi:hypothetical protein